jgi:membrane-anchored protein YejM (alkaline phosphatase superfamily)
MKKHNFKKKKKKAQIKEMTKKNNQKKPYFSYLRYDISFFKQEEH